MCCAEHIASHLRTLIANEVILGPYLTDPASRCEACVWAPLSLGTLKGLYSKNPAGSPMHCEKISLRISHHRLTDYKNAQNNIEAETEMALAEKRKNLMEAETKRTLATAGKNNEQERPPLRKHTRKTKRSNLHDPNGSSHTLRRLLMQGQVYLLTEFHMLSRLQHTMVPLDRP